MTSVLTREKAIRPTAVPTHPSPATARPVILTRAELAECTCPEHCERDHEND